VNDRIDAFEVFAIGVDVGVSDNTRSCWSIVNARQVIGAPQDDSERVFADDIARFVTSNGAPRLERHVSCLSFLLERSQAFSLPPAWRWAKLRVSRCWVKAP
jgi:hypothetical protein